jgi:Ser/Thr protein kinase RdoA (MazF antagonist)
MSEMEEGFPAIAGVECFERLSSQQNLVFRARVDGASVVVRLTSPQHRTASQIDVELDLLTKLAQTTALAVTPRPFPSGRLVEKVWHAGQERLGTLFPYVAGEVFQPASFEAAASLGALLAQLHAALAALHPRFDLPVMSHVPNANRLIHGDFHFGNVLETADSFLVLDFENACYSTHEFEVANCLYMALFAHRDSVQELLQTGLAPGLVAGYARHATLSLSDVRKSLSHRVSMLAGWLAGSDEAPLSVSNSSSEWKATLSSFVKAYGAGHFDAFLRQLT